MTLTPLDPSRQVRHKRRNRLHTVVLAGGSLALLAATAYVFAGAVGIFWAALLGGVSLWMSARVSPELVLRLYRARPLSAEEFPQGHRILRLVAARAGLTGDPEGLASALAKLERSQGRRWEMVLPGGRVPHPSVLRSHPKTGERIRRLLSLKPGARPLFDLPDGRLAPPRASAPLIRGPRYRVSSMGLWY